MLTKTIEEAAKSASSLSNLHIINNNNSLPTYSLQLLRAKRRATAIMQTTKYP